MVEHIYPAGTVPPLSSGACNVTPIIGDRVHKCARGSVYSLVKIANFGHRFVETLPFFNPLY